MFGTISTPIVRRSRSVVLTHVDRRTPLGRRIKQLTAIYLDALGGDSALSDIKRLRIDEAAQLKALAEQARGAWMRDGDGNLDDVVRIERKASAAELREPPGSRLGYPDGIYRYLHPPKKHGSGGSADAFLMPATEMAARLKMMTSVAIAILRMSFLPIVVGKTLPS
jgi:hypothetical protein